MQLRKAFILALALVLLMMTLVPSCSCATVSLGATPSSLEATIERSSYATMNVYVINNGEDSISCTLFVDDAYGSWVEFDHSTFTLDGNDHENVIITITAPSGGEDDNEFYIYITGTSLKSGGTPVSAGLKIPVSVSLTEPPKEGNGDAILIIGAISIAVILTALFLLRRKGGKG